MCLFNNAAGIELDNGGTTCFHMNNKIAYNGDAAMNASATSTAVHRERLLQPEQALRHRFYDKVAHCTGNGMLNNRLFADRGGSSSQSTGSGNGRLQQQPDHRELPLRQQERPVGAGQRIYPVQAAERGPNPVANSHPARLPLTTAAYTNNLNADATVFITGGTITAIAIGGNATGLTFRVIPGAGRPDDHRDNFISALVAWVRAPIPSFFRATRSSADQQAGRT